MTHLTWGIVMACGGDDEIAPGASIPFVNLGSRPVLAYSLQAFERCEDIAGVLVVVPKDRHESVLGMIQMFGFAKAGKIVHGTSHRQGCVSTALRALDEEVTIVVTHEAGRPCVTPALISETVRSAKRYGSGVAAVPIRDPVKTIHKGLVVCSTVADEVPWIAQTPQAFRRETLDKAFAAAHKKAQELRDESQAFELIRQDVHLVESSPENIRIRTLTDLHHAASLLRQREALV
jgi:2-C-methyl-D-erythritol 4-phosphate cytidylyltransferase